MFIGSEPVLRKPQHPQRLQERHKFIYVDMSQEYGSEWNFGCLSILFGNAVVNFGDSKTFASEVMLILRLEWSQWRNLQQYCSKSCLIGSVRKWSKDLGTKKLVVRNFLCSWLFQVNDFSGQGLQDSGPIPEPELYQETSAICYHVLSLLEVCGLVERFVSLPSAVKSSLVLHLHSVVLHVRLACGSGGFFVQPSTIELSNQEQV